MGIYNLEESPDVYIVPRYHNNKFIYQMAVVTGEMSRRIIRTIDLRNDKLMVYGNEIKQGVFERLHQSLVLRPKQGNIYVNCNGACYFLIPAKGCYRPIHNAIFDWSQFGVVLPNSVNDSLRKQLEEMEQEVASAKAEVFISKACLEASQKEVDHLKQQLSTFEKDKEANLKEAYAQLDDLRTQLSRCNHEKRTKEVELKKVKDQLSSINFDSKLNAMAAQLELYKKTAMDLEKQVAISKGEAQKINAQLCCSRQEKEQVEMALEKVVSELESAKAQLESPKKTTKPQLQELQGKSCTRNHMEFELGKMLDRLLSIDSEVKSSNQKLDQLLNSILLNQLPSSTTDLPIITTEEEDQEVPTHMSTATI